METLWSVRRAIRGLSSGDHAWLPYQSQEERVHVIGAFVHHGLAAGEKTICLAGHGAELPHERLAVITFDRFDAAELLGALTAEIAEAADRGYRGVRVTADLTQAAGDGQLAAFERGLGTAIAQAPVNTIAVCQVDRQRCTPDQLDVLARAHCAAVAADPEFEDEMLRIERTFRPDGLAFDGELDASRHPELVRALARVTADAGDREIHLDLSRLGFIDLGALNILANAAHRPARHAPIVLDRLSPQLRTVMDTVGWDMVPGLRLGPAT